MTSISATAQRLGGETARRPYIKIVVISLLAIAASIVILLYLGYSYHRQQVNLGLVDPNRDYGRVPFNLVDATEHCQLRTAHRYGDSLAVSFIDEHSTRFDTRTGLYKIFMFAYVGELHNYQEEVVHCFIDPSRQVLTHYRTISLHQETLMSRVRRFF